VSACPSLPIGLLAARGDSIPEGAPSSVADVVALDLLAVLAGVSDPRRFRGVRRRLVTVLAAAVWAVLAGARTYVAIAEWAHDLPITVRVRLGMGRRASRESTFRRVLRAIDADELDRAVSGWLVARAADRVVADRVVADRACDTGGSVCSIAVDGKTARGARRIDGQPVVHLFAALDHTGGIVLGQVEVGAKTNELFGCCAAPGRAENFGMSGRVDTV